MRYTKQWSIENNTNCSTIEYSTHTDRFTNKKCFFDLNRLEYSFSESNIFFMHRPFRPIMSVKFLQLVFIYLYAIFFSLNICLDKIKINIIIFRNTLFNHFYHLFLYGTFLYIFYLHFYIVRICAIFKSACCNFLLPVV